MCQGKIKPSTRDNVRTECTLNGCYLSHDFDTSNEYGTRHRLHIISGTELPPGSPKSSFSAKVEIARRNNAETTQLMFMLRALAPPDKVWGATGTTHLW